MKKWLLFLIMPTLLNLIISFVADLIFGHSISMNTYCAITGCIYGMLVYGFSPNRSMVIALIWLIMVYIQQYVINIGVADNSDGSRLTQTLWEGGGAFGGAILFALTSRSPTVQQP